MEKQHAGQTMELTGRPPLDRVSMEIVNMVLRNAEAHDGVFLHFYFPDGTELETETEK